MAEYIERDAICYQLEKQESIDGQPRAIRRARRIVADFPAADVVPVPDGGIGEMSDGYHTFNGLYYQRMVLFAALVKAHKDKAWKSWRHEDGELCFGGGWFIVGIDTPQGSYTYHYESKDWDMFDCAELPVAKHWDGHTEEDVTRLLSLDVRPVVRCKDCKHAHMTYDGLCKYCDELIEHGRLIDADALKKNAYPFPCAIGTEWAVTLRQINDAPTIIPAEEGE